MNEFASYLHTFLFGYYPYICMVVFLAGSLARFDRDQYSWKSDSSQMLRAGTLRWGSNLFHVGILFLFIGHFVGLLTPHWLYEPFITPAHKQLLAIVAGGIAGFICFVGLTLLLYRRMTSGMHSRSSPSSRNNSKIPASTGSKSKRGSLMSSGRVAPRCPPA